MYSLRSKVSPGTSVKAPSSRKHHPPESTILLEDGASTDVPELRLLSCGEPWRRWDNVQALPFGGLKIKVIHHASGDFL